MAMVVGVCRLLFSLPGNDSLKGKRAVVRRIVERARNRFNVAAAEVDDQDFHRRLTLGFAVVSNDSSHANSMLDNVISFVAEISEAQLIDRTIELIPIGAHTMGGELP